MAGSKGEWANELAEQAATLLLLHAASGPQGAEAVAAGLSDILGFETLEHIAQLVEFRCVCVCVCVCVCHVCGLGVLCVRAPLAPYRVLHTRGLRIRMCL